MPGRRQPPPGWDYVFLLDERNVHLDEISACAHKMVEVLGRYFSLTDAKAHSTGVSLAVIVPEALVPGYARIVGAVTAAARALILRRKPLHAAIPIAAAILSDPKMLSVFEAALRLGASTETLRMFLMNEGRLRGPAL